ncbi:MAG: hypothetical protein ABI076_08150 [Acidobacteriaceae bacterium]
MKILAGIRQCVMALVVLGGTAPVLFGQAAHQPVVTATAYNSNFPAAAGLGESFNGIGITHDGIIYYVISSPTYNVPGEMYSFNPKTKVITHIANLNDAVGQHTKAVAQGKVHTDFIQDHDKLYFATHLGYYNQAHGLERATAAPQGYLPYPGGHFVSYDLKTKKFDSLAIAPKGEGIITFNMDGKRGRLYGITWPSGYFLRYDLKTKSLKNLGTVFLGGEMGKVGTTYRAICRRIAMDPRDGDAYFTTGDGVIHRYSYDTDSVQAVAGVSLKKDYFGELDPTRPGMAYNWRDALWVPNQNAIYAINGRSDYLFRFDPSVPSVQVVERLASEAAKKTGMYSGFFYGYLGFVLGPDGHTLYYLTSTPHTSGPNAKAAWALPNRKWTDLITYDIATGTYRDHGQIKLADGHPVTPGQSLVMGLDGTLYTVARFVENGQERIDLISFRP